jgi:hypothetical protein
VWAGGRGNKFAQRKANKKNMQSQIKEGNKEKYLPLKFRNKFQHNQTAKKFVQAENSLPRPPPPLKKL